MGAHAQTRELIEAAADVLAEYEGRITLRQLYYQLVVRQVIANEEREYKRLSRALVDARMKGLIPWEALEDRLRQPTTWAAFRDLSEYLGLMRSGYHRDLRQGQYAYVEVWVEKDALRGIFEDACRWLQVPVMAVRGYASASAKYDAGRRINHWLNMHEECEGAAILYFGDFDPSGQDIGRDIRETLPTWPGLRDRQVTVCVKALTENQVREYDLPPAPAKRTDTRAVGFIAEHGDGAVELDALPPDVLERMIVEAVADWTDEEAIEEERRAGEEELAELHDLCQRIRDMRREREN